MPSKQDHISKAEHNEQFASTINGQLTGYWDWVVTGYFYSALHYVEAYLATKDPPVHSSDHRARDDEIGRDLVLSQIYDEYSDLKNDSTNARYTVQPFSPITIANYVIPNHTRVKTYLLSRI
jgi:hypothetical protein